MAWMIGILGSDSWQGPTWSPIQWVLGALFLGVNQLGHEVDHSPTSSTKVKNAWIYTSTPQYIFIARHLVKHRKQNPFSQLENKLYHPTVKVLVFCSALTEDSPRLGIRFT